MQMHHTKYDALSFIELPSIWSLDILHLMSERKYSNLANDIFQRRLLPHVPYSPSCAMDPSLIITLSSFIFRKVSKLKVKSNAN